jgi:hypothetical protein
LDTSIGLTSCADIETETVMAALRIARFLLASALIATAEPSVCARE